MKQTPPILYGTAWKEDDTAPLVELALRAGFRGIDTANQRKHYHEAAVGKALLRAYEDDLLKREDLFIQTKYTFARGQDHRKPYDEHADIATQVGQSFASSLEHLHTDKIDSYVLHGPTLTQGLVEQDLQAWQAMEALVDSQQVSYLGISNVNLEQLQTLCQNARIKPKFVQNRTFARTGWDKVVRDFCSAEGIIYQGFSLLTANMQEINQAQIWQLAQKYRKGIPQIIFKFAIQMGMLPLTGTSSRTHMAHDLDLAGFELLPEEILMIESI